MVRSFPAQLPGWIGVAAMLGGALLCAATGALPERWQGAALYLGVGLAFASVGGTLVNLTISAPPQWRGAATLIGSMLGAMPLLFIVWHNMREGPLTAVPLPESRATLVTPSLSARVASRPRSPAAAGSPAARQTQLQPVLARISEILGKRARAALDDAAATLRGGRERELDARTVRVRLSSTARDLEEVRTSLQEIQARHDELPAALTSVIGDTGALDDLIANLRWLSDMLENDVAGTETLARSENEPQRMTAPVEQWLARCIQQIADLSAAVASAS